MCTTHHNELPTKPPPTPTVPTRFGVVLFPAFQAIDVFGPLEALNILSETHHMSLSLIATTLSPVSTGFSIPKVNSNFSESVVPTHTFATAPALDVLIVPGGQGTRFEDIGPVIDFIRNTYPSLQYLITVCTGSRLAARAGVLDGKRATTNKAGWALTTSCSPNVSWVAKARWVTDGNVWTSAGASAGMDVTLAWMEEVFGGEVAGKVTDIMEYDRHLDSTWDPFAEKNGLTEPESR